MRRPLVKPLTRFVPVTVEPCSTPLRPEYSRDGAGAMRCRVGRQIRLSAARAMRALGRGRARRTEARRWPAGSALNDMHVWTYGVERDQARLVRVQNRRGGPMECRPSVHPQPASRPCRVRAGRRTAGGGICLGGWLLGDAKLPARRTGSRSQRRASSRSSRRTGSPSCQRPCRSPAPTLVDSPGRTSRWWPGRGGQSSLRRRGGVGAWPGKRRRRAGPLLDIRKARRVTARGHAARWDSLRESVVVITKGDRAVGRTSWGRRTLESIRPSPQPHRPAVPGRISSPRRQIIAHLERTWRPSCRGSNEFC